LPKAIFVVDFDVIRFASELFTFFDQRELRLVAMVAVLLDDMAAVLLDDMAAEAALNVFPSYYEVDTTSVFCFQLIHTSLYWSFSGNSLGILPVLL
jgi:hypothetical protein